ncbi:MULTISPECIES: TetR/AcrR family transcriptional regulator [Mycobacterium]|uniref:TetR family transcriptional regulator n=3 Tax=Mycobacterium ulcerans group TaxID=2993898 RepID=A0A9N7QLV7_9MYCO|nr:MULTISPECIES: TetR/AcrR family transcriptional regulator [Mycobacterium]ULL08892.1 TetR/AcrR family transcriptional regulator [Mycobacterium liflandii]AGC60228.1 transcriptional regulatory protein [Mycobacterium liflandii 128FXT]EPQ44839.1 Transcriptional regulator, TetR family [Mycobacterium sp. 012931]EPQ70874.1 Transcriptional regulator, TetR family [Mycobacterium marinum MB2]MBC9862839.1 Transcriptional regulator, TetR family [Mycobacterium pseudoshottsii]
MISTSGTERRADGRQLRYQHRRGEIFDAVMAHVLEHGITGLSFRTLAAAVGVSHVTLRHHFGTKDQLLVEILGAIGTRIVIPEQLGADDVEALWRRWNEPGAQRRSQLLFEAYAQAVRHPDEYRGFLDRIVTDWIETIRQHAVQAGCPSEEAENFATLLIAQLRGLQFDLLASNDRARVAAALGTVVDGVRAKRAEWDASR